MDFNICVVQPPGYIHSQAFAELAELLSFGLQDLGHGTAITANQIAPNARNLVIGCHLLAPNMADNFPPDTIILNTEQIFDDQNQWNRNVLAWSERFEMWDYSARNVELIRGFAGSNARLLRLGYHPRLQRIAPAPVEDIDVLFYGR